MYIIIYSIYQELADGDCGLVACCDTEEEAKEIMKKNYTEEILNMSQSDRDHRLWLHPDGLMACLDEQNSEKADHWIWKIEKIG